ncbi:PREDICTED: defensin-1-like [Polistes dominula]|uniref:Defensin-1-like n=1 Tax=Polistes dominula TaxID=743375 RepID=A0ABM1HTZ7_POLDO|nr:PREDICTED: defensin-1-like [Polistes dominula]
MTKLCIILSILFVIVAVNMAAPVEDDRLENLMELDDEFREDMVEERADRQRRVTCDLLSFGGMIGSSACAANCLSMGKAGGYCSSGICVCRKDSFKDLWNKRFG